MWDGQKRLEVLQDNPEPLVGLTGLIATAVGAYFLQDYWYPWYEGAVRFARSVSTVRPTLLLLGSLLCY